MTGARHRKLMPDFFNKIRKDVCHQESTRVNLNALGDRVVSFAVLALSASPDGSMVAACTDRSRVIVLQVLPAGSGEGRTPGSRRMRRWKGSKLRCSQAPLAPLAPLGGKLGASAAQFVRRFGERSLAAAQEHWRTLMAALDVGFPCQVRLVF